MSNITITIEASELVTAINNLANALAAGHCSTVNVMPPTQAAAVAPIGAPAQPVMPSAPVAPPATTAPIAAPEYTLEQLAVAATPLVDAGRQQELSGLLAQFGVQALTQLPKEQYGTFATGLRGLGAKI